MRGTGINRGLLIIVVAASIVLGVLFSLLVSSDSITQKAKDEILHKSDDQHLASVVVGATLRQIGSHGGRNGKPTL